MADYYTHISFAFEATDEQHAAFEAAFDPELAWTSFDELTLPAELEPFVTVEELKKINEDDEEVTFGDVEVERYDGTTGIYGSNPYLERVALLVQAIMKPEKPIGFQWSNDCSKHRTDAFGGGCCAIFKDKIEWAHTATILEGMMSDG